MRPQPRAAMALPWVLLLLVLGLCGLEVRGEWRIRGSFPSSPPPSL